ncbi:MAG: EAL domain-containing protein, partial [Cellulomonas sp.]|nr:EAL domain-containing protein [Cellulomonas sp.]
MHHRPVDVAAWLAPARAGRPVLRRGGGDAAGPRDALAAPLEVDGVVVALLVVQDRPHHLGPFTADDLQLLESLANHAAVALHKSRLVGQLRTDAATQEHASLHDALTGLPNRRHALLALTAELAASMNTAVLVLDLDGFTQVNEAFGYAVGDRVLRETGRRLALHATGPGHVARLGNDEFVIVLRDVADADDAVRRAEEILGSLSAPVTFDELSLDVRGCAGLAAAPAHGADAELLLQRADAAMYAAKRDRATLRVWDPVTEGESARRLVLLGHLREAVAARQLTVHYQPKVALGSGQVVGAEALARWEHPDHGRVCPDEFIPLAEHAGLIVPLTDQVLAAALAQCALWRVSVPGFTMAVNLSARSLVDPDLPAQVGAALDRAALPGAALMLEITETAIMTDLDRALVVLRGIEALGVGLSIDDFGTGQSSLAYLKLLPVHEVKVDRSFVHG